jgi:hypothetical protein
MPRVWSRKQPAALAAIVTLAAASLAARSAASTAKAELKGHAGSTGRRGSGGNRVSLRKGGAARACVARLAAVRAGR